MKEIKFRVWDKENKEMLDVEYLHWDDCTKEFSIRTTMYTDYFDEQDMILMQFTGLHDKNGKEIYEGDIVQILGGEYEQGFHEWDEKVQIKDLIYDGYNLMMTISQIGNKAIKVIGNIYENPELLKGTDNIE